MANSIVSSEVTSTGAVVHGGGTQDVRLGVETGGNSYVQGTASGTILNGGVELVDVSPAPSQSH
jgi:hypothetical protein